jgi:hypothetical protein
MAEKKKEFIIPRRSQKAIEEDPDVLIRIGVTQIPMSYKGSLQLSGASLPTGPLKEKVLLTGWKVYDKDLSTDKGVMSASNMSLMKITVSKSSPYTVMRKSAGFSDKDADAVMAFLGDHPVFINRSDPRQFDRISGEYVGKKASLLWFVEDMRTFRTQKVSDHDDTIEISFRLREMKNDTKKLRDTLYLIGESPAGDTAEELYFQLSTLVIDNPKSQARRNFLDFIVNPTLKTAHIELTKLINKATDCGVITTEKNFYTYQGTRLGNNLMEVIQHLEYDSDILKSIKIGLANESGLEEDVEEAHSVAAKVNGTEDTAKAIAWVSDHMKASGLYKNPAVALNGKNTLEEAIEVFNNKAKAEGLPKEEFLTVEKVMENI